MILGHGFAPISEGEVRSDLLGLAEMLGSVVVFKIVELREAEEKVCLRRRRARILECHLTEALLGQRRHRA